MPSPHAQVVERASKARPQVKQAKILLEENAGGVPRSKGIGFVEFDNHEHALCALRQLNNNPQAWGKVGRSSTLCWLAAAGWP